MKKFLKRPAEVEAMQYLGTAASAGLIIEWITEHFEEFEYLEANESPDHAPKLYVVTLEGKMLVSPGDWVIKGIKNEFYPCKPDIFAETYEPVPTGG